MSETLICYLAVGPTFKERVITNLERFPQYDLFDVLVLTDDVEFFAGLNRPNVFIEDLTALRNRYPEFLPYEVLIEEKRDHAVYASEIRGRLNNHLRFPLHLQRFALLYKNISKYSLIALADCDVTPLFTPERYADFLAYFANEVAPNSVGSNRAFYLWERPEVVSWAKDTGVAFKMTIDESRPLCSFDGPLKFFKFKDASAIRRFFELWNATLFKAFKENSVILQGSWNCLSEQLLGIVYNLFRMTVDDRRDTGIALTDFKAFTYPEDRFWDDIGHRHFDISTATKEDFIRVNYDKLKEFYNDYGQPFPY